MIEEIVQASESGDWNNKFFPRKITFWSEDDICVGILYLGSPMRFEGNLDKERPNV